ncbi:MAG: DUF3617 domain-containing protein [Candidatus Korobacteraceae bacterium]
MRKILVVSAIGLLATVVFAQSRNYPALNVKAGLWQVTITTTMSGQLPPNLQARLDQMTPEQRARIEAQFGATPHTRTFKKCVKQEDLARDPFSGRDEKCRWTLVNSNSSEMEMRGTSCEAGKNQGMETDVDMKIHALDSENVKASVKGTATGNGQTMTVSGSYTGKWLGSACPADAE